MKKIAASILSADFTRLAEEIAAMEEAGADYLHIDVMDGHFVPNITVGPPVVQAIKNRTRLPLDVHLMIEKPECFLEAFVKAGAEILSIQAEASVHLHRTVHTIKELGAEASVVLNPATPLSTLDFILSDVDMVLIMTVNPGFGGQRFLPEMVPKVEALRKKIDETCAKAKIEVDGGINVENIGWVSKAGADIFVSGTGIFGTKDYKSTISRMREALNG